MTVEKIIRILIVLVFISLSGKIYSQSTSIFDRQKYEIEVENFLGMFDGIFTDELIDQISYNLPDELKIVNYGIGDFSGDGNLDVGIAYRDRTCPPKTFKVVLLVNQDNVRFIKVLEIYAKWRDTPYDVGFTIKKNFVNVIYRRNKNWIFASYTANNAKLKLIREEMY